MKIFTLFILVFLSSCKYLNRGNETKSDDSVSATSSTLELFKSTLSQAGLGLNVPVSGIPLLDEKDVALTAQSIRNRIVVAKWNANIKNTFIKVGLSNALLQDSLKEYFTTVLDLILFDKDKGSKFFEDTPDKLMPAYEKAFNDALNPQNVESMLFYFIPTIRFVDDQNVCFYFGLEKSEIKNFEFKDFKKGVSFDEGAVKHVEFSDYGLSNPMSVKNYQTIPVVVSYMKTSSASLKYEIKTAPLGKNLSSLSGDGLFPECDAGSCFVTIDTTAKNATCAKYFVN